eukprot:TRINITY_DN5509_c0_g2_i1.p1 TRINITY_DN5509_c0_g2~~TRINITY_DN5509_c0_g2_i1.p1  ORF type:complete len:410 (-),score=46.36 TRINITY_DN5509_c0_g2_i1:954-2183(-)
MAISNDGIVMRAIGQRLEEDRRLIHAILKQDIRQIRQLLGYGVSANGHPMSVKGPPLHLAAQEGCTKCVKLLIEAGGDINNFQGPFGPSGFRQIVTPLHVAVKNGNVGMVRLLTLMGADVDIPDRDGMTVRFLVRGRKELYQALEQALQERAEAENQPKYSNKSWNNIKPDETRHGSAKLQVHDSCKSVNHRESGAYPRRFPPPFPPPSSMYYHPSRDVQEYMHSRDRSREEYRLRVERNSYPYDNACAYSSDSSPGTSQPSSSGLDSIESMIQGNLKSSSNNYLITEINASRNQNQSYLLREGGRNQSESKNPQVGPQNNIVVVSSKARLLVPRLDLSKVINTIDINSTPTLSSSYSSDNSVEYNDEEVVDWEAVENLPSARSQDFHSCRSITTSSSSANTISMVACT